jgi:hypothetical protein
MDPVKLMQRYLAQCEECCDCLLWTGPMYQGMPKVAGKGLRRRVWEMREGKIPEGMMVGVSCGRANCIEHLELRSRADQIRANMARPNVLAKRSVNSRQLQRARAAKLDMEKARAIRASTKTQRELSEEYDIAPSLVSRVKNNQSWVEGVNPFAGLVGALA